MLGGDFQIKAELLLRADTGNSPLDRINEGDALLDTGRSAIHAAIASAIDVKKIKKAWVPFYSCQTMIQPFYDHGLEVNFYGVGKDLASPIGLPDRLDDCLFLFVHYFGRFNEAISSYLLIARTQNTVVIEDVVQSCMNSAHGRIGNYVVHSLRKFLPVPDGAILAGPKAISINPLPANETFISLSLLSKISRAVSDVKDTRHIALKNMAEDILDDCQAIREMSSFTRRMLPKFDLSEIQSRRRQNWQQLSDAFATGTLKNCAFRPLYEYLPEADVPLLFPVVAEADKRDAILEKLRQEAIFCPVHWKLGSPAKAWLRCDFDLSRSLFSIPIDQRVTSPALDQAIDRLWRVDS